MENNKIEQVLERLEQLNENIVAKLDKIETRLSRLEKVDSIEHRVTVNQIDLTDIKEILQNLGDKPSEGLISLVEGSIERFEKSYQKHFDLLHRRMDSQLLKIAKTEEEIIMIKDDQKA